MICPFLFMPVGLVIVATIYELVSQGTQDWKDTHPNINHLNYETKKYRTHRNYFG